MKTLLKLASLLLLLCPSLVVAQTATINWTAQDQVINGFGAGNNFVQSSMNPYDNLLFNTLGYSLLRSTVPLSNGVCDGSPSSSCATAQDSTIDMQSCVANGCSVWVYVSNPPGEYNSSGSFNCTVNPALKPASYGAFASYITNFVASLQTFIGVHPFAVSAQNEPDNTNACQMSPTQMQTFIKVNLGPTMSSAGQTSTLIMMPEVEAYSDYTTWAGPCMGDGSCSPFVGINAFHDYGNASSVSNSYGKLFWETEVSDIAQASPVAPGCPGNIWCPTISDGILWATKIYEDIIGGANAWHYFWYVDNDTTYGTNANVALINPAQGTPIAKRAYTIANYAKFVRPGYFRIDATANPQAGILITAYQNTLNGKIVIVAINSNGSDTAQTFSITNAPTFTTFTPYITSASLNLAQQSPISTSVNGFTYTLPANSVTTLTAQSGGGGGGGGPTANIYYAPVAAGSNNGTSCGNAYAYNDGTFGWSVAGMYGTGTGQIGPDTVIHDCGGTHTGAAGSTILTFGGGGSAGHPVVFQCDSPATFTAPYWAGNPNGAISMGANSYITLNGNNCTLTSTANGTNLANQTANYGITGTGSNQSVIGWTITNFYVRIAGGHELSDNSVVRAISLDGPNDVVDGNTIDMNGWAINLSGTADNAIVRNNSIQHSGHGGTLGGAHWYFYNNHVYNFGVWDSDNDAYHQDGLHCFAGVNGNTIVGYVYNNRFDGTWGQNMNQPIFLEQGDSSTKCFVDNGKVYIFNNVEVGDGFSVNTGFNSYGGTSITTNGDLLVNNLAILNNPTGNAPVGMTIHAVPSAHCPTCTNTFENNAISSTGLAEADAVATTFNTMDYNAIENCRGTGFQCYASESGATAATIAAWRIITAGQGQQYETHGIANEAAAFNVYFKLNNACTPGSVNANCAPQAGSPLLNAGANLFSLCNGQPSPGLGDMCKDILGNSRPNSAWTIGPYQITGSTPTAATPSCLPGTGSYSISVTISCNVTGGAPVICYTTDGSTPITNGAAGCTHGTLYSGSFSITSTSTLKSIAGGSGFLDGSIFSATYTITLPVAATPVCNPAGGTFTTTQNVTCTSSAPVICYTTNGTIPATNGSTGCTTGTKYTVAISVSSSLTLRAIAGGTNTTDSSVAVYNFIVSSPIAAKPTCSPAAGTYTAAQSVTCSATTGPTLCYTVDGSTPATNGTTGCTHGTLYSGAITVSATETLNIIAGGTAFADGSVATYAYTIQSQGSGAPCPNCLAGMVTNIKAEAF